MRYFVGLRAEEPGVIDFENMSNVEFYLYDFDNQEVRVQPYSEIQNDMFLVWKKNKDVFEAISPITILNSVKYDEYSYMYFNRKNECISKKKLLMIGEHPLKGIAILNTNFELFYTFKPFNFNVKNPYLSTYDFVQEFTYKSFSMCRLPVLQLQEDIDREAGLRERFAKMVATSELLDRESAIPAITKSIKRLILDSEVKPFCSITKPHTSDGESDAICEMLLPSDEAYFKKIGGKYKRIYICFPPLTKIGTAAWEGYTDLFAVKFTRVEFISSNAFAGCSDLEYVEFPTTCQFEIGKGAFSGTKLKTVVLPTCLVNIDKKAFIDCSELEKIIVKRKSSEIKGAKSRANIIYNKLVSQYGEDKVMFEDE